MHLRKLFEDLGFTYYPKFVQKCRKVAELSGTDLENYKIPNVKLIAMGLSTKLKTEYDVPIEFAILVVEHTVITNPNRAAVLAMLYKEKGIAVVTTALPRKETRFVAELCAYLNVLGVSVETQKYIGVYRVDVYVPKYNLVIEYDEKAHLHAANIRNDLKREQYLYETLVCSILRISESMLLGEALAEIQKVLTRIDSSKLTSTGT